MCFQLTFKRRNSGTRADHKREPIPQSWGSKGKRSETISLKPSLRFNQKFVRNRTESKRKYDNTEDQTDMLEQGHARPCRSTTAS